MAASRFSQTLWGDALPKDMLGNEFQLGDVVYHRYNDPLLGVVTVVGRRHISIQLYLPDGKKHGWSRDHVSIQQTWKAINITKVNQQHIREALREFLPSAALESRVEIRALDDSQGAMNQGEWYPWKPPPQ